MKKIIALVGILCFGVGCSSGLRSLGQHRLLDGRIIEYVQVGTEGQDGPKLVVVEGFIYDDASNTSTKISQHSASGTSLIGMIMTGSGAAAIAAGGFIGGQYARRPNKTTITTTQGGAVSTSTNSPTTTTTTTNTNTSINSPTSTINNDPKINIK